jgi:hypothetical protein
LESFSLISLEVFDALTSFSSFRLDSFAAFGALGLSLRFDVFASLAAFPALDSFATFEDSLRSFKGSLGVFDALASLLSLSFVFCPLASGDGDLGTLRLCTLGLRAAPFESFDSLARFTFLEVVSFLRGGETDGGGPSSETTPLPKDGEGDRFGLGAGMAQQQRAGTT